MRFAFLHQEQNHTSEIDDYEEQSFEVLFIPDDAVECVTVWWIKVRVREGGHIIMLREREGGGGARANLDAAGGGTYLIFPLVKLILGPPPPPPSW